MTDISLPDIGRNDQCAAGVTPPKSTYLFTIPWFPSSPVGGVNQSIFNLIHYMRRDGRYRPLPAVINGPDNPPQPEHVECRVISLRLRDPGDPGFFFRAPLAFLFWLPWTLLQLRKLVVSHQIRAIIQEFPGAEGLTFVIFKVLGLLPGNVILVLQGNDIKEASASKGLRRFLHKLTFRLADCVVACSHGIRQDLLNFEPRCEPHSMVIHNTVNIDSYQTQHLSLSTLPESIRGRRFLLNIGKFEHKKGQDTLLLAFESVAQSFPELMLVLIGATGPKTDEIRQRVQSSRWSGRILMFENVPHHEVASYLKAASIFVLPSRREGLPFAILEAAACKVPVIATEIPGVNEVVTENVTGRLVPVDNPDELARAISDLLEDDEKRQMFANRLFELVSTRFTWDSAYHRYLTLNGDL